MEYVLYVLKLKSNDAFKVGITNSLSSNRIRNLHKIYNFNLEESYIVKSKEKIIKQTEKQLLTEYECFKYNFDIKQDGSTEFLKISCFDSLLNSIKFKAALPHLKLSIEKGVILAESNIEPKLINKSKKNKKIRPRKTITEPKLSDFDFSEYEFFKQLIIEHKEKLKFEVEFREKNGITGRIGRIIVKDLTLCKGLFIKRSIILNNPFDGYWNYCHSANYDKAGNVGWIGLSGIPDSYNDGNFFNNRIVHDKIKDLYDFLTKNLPTTVTTDLVYNSFINS